MLSGSRWLVLVAFGLGLSPVPSLAGQNRYDILARVLQPYAALFYSKSAAKAAQLEIVIRSIEGNNATANAALLNEPIEINFQWPDKLRLEITDPTHRVIVCRDGQGVWVYPREFGAELVATASNAEKSARLPDFRLPIQDQEIVLLPVMFRILHLNNTVDSCGSAAWDLEFRTDPVLEKQLQAPQIIVSVLVRQSDYAVEHLKMRSGVWSGEMDVNEVHFVARLPDETWQPSADLGTEAVELPPTLLRAALRKVTNLNLW